MKRRPVLLLGVLGAMLMIAALASPKKEGLLLLEWAAKASHETPAVAILIEMGMKDQQPSSWSGRAKVKGAKVVHREGYSFRDTDKLVDPDAWEVSSHRPLRAPKGQPAVIRMEGMHAIGVVLHLTDVQPEAVVEIEPKEKQFNLASVPLRDLLTGQPKPIDGGKMVVRLISTATPVVTGKTEDDFPAAAYGPDGTLWLAYISYTLKDESRRVEQGNYKEQPKDFKALYTPEFGDQLFVKSYRDGKWSEPIAITGPHEDLMRCAIGLEASGAAQVTYSVNRQGNYDIYWRTLDSKANPPSLGPEQRLTTDPGPDLAPVICTDPLGQVDITWLHPNEKGLLGIRWNPARTPLPRMSSRLGPLNVWNPVSAAGPRDTIANAFDVYQDGDYDVHVFWRRIEQNSETRTENVRLYRVATSSRFEARPSITFDPQGRLWIAYEEGPMQWGKDSGSLFRTGDPLYSDRSVRVVCLDTDGKLKRPVAELPTSAVGNPGAQVDQATTNRNEKATRYAYPKIGIDGKGRVWLTYRQNFGSRYTTHGGNYWLTFARRLDGDKWSEPIELHHSDGLLDSRPALLPHPSGGLIVLHNTDGRHTEPETIHNKIYMSVVNLPGEPMEPKLVPHDPGKKDPQLVKEAEEERNAVKRIRDYHIEVGGKTYRPLRGEFHRHTEISWDGAADGSLEDMFRYGIDAAALDWIGNADHDNGGGREYSWWLIQKLTDAYHVKNAFTPMFTYERSVVYPMGHRNCMFAQRGVRTLPRLAPGTEKPTGGVHPDDTKMLYRYLHEFDGICASHTSATGMGTDWRDNDPQVEPIVEIYQGDRNNYEYEGAPRSGHDVKSGKLPVQIAGWYPDGFIIHALKDKGYHLGFQSSSDHWSTHISFCVPLAERHDRQAILDAMKKRHCYAATDDIILDVRSGQHLMGDEFKTSEIPALQMAVIGTKPIAQIVVLRDSEVVDTLRPGKQEYRATWTDPSPTAGVHYYYIRVEQSDGQLAWASPMWIDYAK